jgi:hypothetical protein
MKTKKIIRKVIKFLELEFNVTQYKWGRKLFGGEWYLIFPRGLPMGTFWSDKQITSCRSETLQIEKY